MRIANCLPSAVVVVFLAGVCPAADVSVSGPQPSEQAMPIAPSDPWTPPTVPNGTPITVDSVSASTASSDAPTRITITGAGFGPGTRVALHEGGMVEVGEYHHRLNANSKPSPIAVNGRLVFVGNLATYSLEVLDIQDPAAPRRIGELRNFYPGDLAAANGMVYSRTYDDVQAVDVHDPTNPRRCGGVDRLPSLPLAMTTSDNALYVNTADDGVAIFDATNGCQPALVGTIPSDGRYGRYSRLAANGDKLLAIYTWEYGQELQVFDTSVPTAPERIGVVDIAAIGGASAVAATQDRAFLATESGRVINTIHVVDLIDPRNPRLIPVSDPDYVYAQQIAVCGDVVYTGNGVQAIDVSNPGHPRLMKTSAGIPYFSRDPIAVDDFVVVGIPDGIATARTPGRPPVPPTAFYPTNPSKWIGYAVGGNRLYFEESDGPWDSPHKITVFDVSDPSNPRQDPSWSFAIPSDSRVVAAVGSYALVLGNHALEILDATDPSIPVLAGSVTGVLGSSARVFGAVVLSVGPNGIQWIDASDPTRPSIAGTLQMRLQNPVWDVEGTTLYLVDASSLLRIVDFSDAANPRIAGTLQLSTTYPGGLNVRGRYVYIDGANAVVDARDPSAPRILARYPWFAMLPNPVAMDGFLYGTVSVGGSTLDIRDPSRPTVSHVTSYSAGPTGVLPKGYLLMISPEHGLAAYRPPQPLRILEPVSDASLTFEIPAGYPPGSYHVAAEQPDGTTARLFNAIQIIANRPPAADAGPDQVVECTGALKASATLDGSASADPDSAPGTNDDIVSFDWSEGGVSLATGVTATVPFQLGVHDVTLTVTDKAGATGTDDTMVTVRDTIPPAGAVTSPGEGQCFGPSTIPVMVTDSFTDVCDPTILRTYSPPPGPLYSTHGDHHVAVTAMDTSGNAATTVVDFTIDTVPPVVQLLAPPQSEFVLPRGLPFAIVFKDGDDDGATGGVVHEVVKLQGCAIYDGATYGNGDGLLSDETLQLNITELCRIAVQCGFTEMVNPELRVEATDCGGNVGFASRTLPGSVRLVGGVCGQSTPAPTRRVPAASRGGAPKPAKKDSLTPR